MGSSQGNKKFFHYRTKRNKLYKVYFKSINGILKLTDKEIDIVSKFYHYMDIIKESVSDEDMRNELLFSKVYKSRIREELGITNVLLNNYVGTLKKKGIIKVVGSLNKLDDRLSLPVQGQNVQVVFNFVIKDESDEG